MRGSKRSPYTRLATDADKQAWVSCFAPIALVGFVPVIEAGIAHWAAVVRNRNVATCKRHTLHRLCDRRKVKKPTPMVEVNCMTCVVRIERGFR